MKRHLMAALAVSGTLATFAAMHPANAIPATQPQHGQAVQGGMTAPVAHRGPGGGGIGPHLGGGGRGMFAHGPGPGGVGPRLYSGPRGPRHGGVWHGGPPGGHHHHHRPHFRGYSPFYAYPAYYYDDYAYSDGDDCGWLRRRAEATGSRYWWSRYRACIED